MHQSVMKYFESVKQRYPEKFRSSMRVLEMGSFNVNGSVRALFEPGVDYTGIDARPGPGVDLVCVAHQYDGPKVDIVVSTEMLEHDPYWKKSIYNAMRLLHPSGIFAFTCAAPNRQPHELEMSPTPGYYGNRSIEEIEKCITDSARDLKIQLVRTEIRLDRSDLDLLGYLEIE